MHRYDRSTSGPDGPARIDLRRELEGLADGPRRYLRLAIQPGAVVPDAARIQFRGRMRIPGESRWYDVEAENTISASRAAFHWEAFARRGLRRVTLVDRLSAGRASVTKRRRGPLGNERRSGPDVYHGALGRLAFDSLLMPWMLAPSQGATWRHTNAPSSVDVVLDGVPFTIDIDVELDGRPSGARTELWAPRDESSHGYLPFGATFGRTGFFGGYTIPVEIEAGWWPGTDWYVPAYELEVERVQFGRALSERRRHQRAA